ncbi:MAG: 4Fe-4S binding protein, partial [Planctomycetes bacterium]|nr:4Fe-4S binding protein [Planctomycetota bacterium]
MSKKSLIRLDVLRPSACRSVLRARWFPVALQVLALLAVVGLAWIGFSVGPDRPASELLTLRKTNITTLVVWGLWWPGLIALTLLFGRVWCTVCPMELVHRLGDAAGRGLALRRPPLGPFLRAGWMTLLAYFLLQVLVAGAALHRNPHYTAWLLAALFLVAFASGLVFRGGRAFCAGFCPASALLSVYGRFTPVQLEKRDAAACEECRDRQCVAAKNRARFDRRSCPSYLRPYERAPSDGCVLCLQCAKVCPQGNIGLGLVSRAAGVRRQSLLRPFEVL